MSDKELLKALIESYIIIKGEVMYRFGKEFPLENVLGHNAYNELKKRIIGDE